MNLRVQLRRWAACAGVAVLAASIGLTASAQAADKKFKIFLSMSYIGNDWQAEAANMVKAMAAHKDFADKVDLQVQVAGPNAQRQIQQLNAMVQQGAQAIVVYPISPTALNNAVRNACDKGVMIIAYDGAISEPCAYNVTINQEEAGRVTAEWLAKKLNGKGNIIVMTGVPGTSVDTLRTKAAKEVFAKYPDIKIVGQRQRTALAREQMARDDVGPPRRLIEPAQHRIDFAVAPAKAAALDRGKHVAFQQNAFGPLRRQNGGVVFGQTHEGLTPPQRYAGCRRSIDRDRRARGY